MKFQKYLIFNLWVCVTDSPRWLQIALEKEKVEEEKCFEETDHHLRVLTILAQETDREAVIEELKNRLQRKGDYFKVREMMIKEKKFPQNVIIKD